MCKCSTLKLHVHYIYVAALACVCDDHYRESIETCFKNLSIKIMLIMTVANNDSMQKVNIQPACAFCIKIFIECVCDDLNRESGDVFPESCMYIIILEGCYVDYVRKADSSLHNIITFL